MIDELNGLEYLIKFNQLDTKLLERFNKKINKDIYPDCWIWTSNLTKDGYGILNLKQGKNVLAHHLSFYLKRKYVPYGLSCVCGNKMCVNPDHWGE